MSTLRLPRALAVPLLAALVGCPRTFDLPEGAKVSCVQSEDCGEWVCDQGQCVNPASLTKKCQSTADCDDGVWCNGAERCEQGFCLSPLPPCGSSFDCVVATCVESTGGTGECSVAPDHSVCKPGFYCSPLSGCVEGQRCSKDLDCQDDSVCNGAERCYNYHCIAGLEFDPGDGNPCTIDFCTERLGATHLADPLMVHAPCTLAEEQPGGPDRVCNDAGECVVSDCGDRIVDPRTEACDDGNDDPNDGCQQCKATSWEPVIVTGLGRHQGQPERLTLYYPQQLAVGRDGAIYVPDYWADRIWQIEPQRAFVVAGLGMTGFSGDGGPAPAAQLNGPISVAVDGLGNLYVADRVNNRIRRVDASTRRITTLAGGGTSTEEGALADSVRVNGPVDLVVDGQGNVFYIDEGAEDDLRDPETIRRIRRIDAATLRVHTVAGNPDAATDDDGDALAVRLENPHALALADAEMLYVAETTRIRRLELAYPVDRASGTIQTVAGNRTLTNEGNHMSALLAGVSDAFALAVDAAGDLFLTDYPMGAIRRVHFASDDPRSGVIDTVVGNGASDAPIEGPALGTLLPDPEGLAVAPDGSLLISEVQTGSVLRVVRPSSDPSTWTVSRVAGGYDDLESTANSPPSTLRLFTNNLATRGEQLYFSDRDRNVVWKVEIGNPEDALTWRLRRIAGGGSSTEENVPALEAALDFAGVEGPLAFDSDGTLYIGDTGNYRVRRVSLDPASPGYRKIETVVGSGSPGLAVDLFVTAMAFDPQGRLFVAGENRAHRVTRVDPRDPATWTIEAVLGGDALARSNGDGPAALAAGFKGLWGLAFSPTHLFLSDYEQNRVRAVPLSGEPSGWTIFDVAGTDKAGFSGDGQAARTATLDYPAGIAWDPASQSLLVTDKRNDAVRRVTASGADPADWTIETIHDPVSTEEPFFGDGGPLSAARFHEPVEVVISDAGALFIDMFDTIRRVDPVTQVVTTIMGGADPAGDGRLTIGGLGTPRALARIDAVHFAVADGSDGRVRLVDLASGEVRTVAGYPGGKPGAGLVRYSRLLEEAAGVAWDEASRSLFVSEEGGHTLRRLWVGDLERPWTWTIEDFAGVSGEAGHADGTLAASRFYGPSGLALDATERILYVAESTNHDVRAIRIDAPKAGDCVSTVAGVPGHLGFFEGPQANAALFHGPTALALDGQGGLYVADTENHRVRRVDLAAGTVRTVLGTGHGASSGEGSPATYFPVDSPSGLSIDGHGNLFVTSRDSIREVTRSALGPVESGQGDVFTLHGPATAGDLSLPTHCLTGLLLDGDAGFYVLDQCQGAMLRFARR